MQLAKGKIGQFSGFASPVLTPDQIFGSRLHTWINTDRSTITKDGSNNVSQIDDLTGNGRHFEAIGATPGVNWPLLVPGELNGKPVLRFDGVAESMRVDSKPQSEYKFLNDGTAEYYVVIVAKIAQQDPDNIEMFLNTGTISTSGNSFMIYVDDRLSQNRNQFLRNNVNRSVGSSWAIGNDSGNGYFLMQEWVAITIKIDPFAGVAAGRSTIRINNQNEIKNNISTSSFNTLDPAQKLTLAYEYALGLYANIDVAEIIVIDDAVTPTEESALYNYLQDEWALLTGDISLALHLDASDSSTVNLGSPVNNDPVDTWLDKSLSNNNASQSTPANQPVYKSSGFGVNSLPYIEFDGASEFMNLGKRISKMSNHTAIIVFETDNTTSSQTGLSDLKNTATAGTSSIQLASFSSTDDRLVSNFGDGTNNSQSKGSTVLSPSTPYIHTNTYTDGDTELAMYLNGVAETVTPIATASSEISGTAYGMAIGRAGEFSGNYFNGKIAEIKIWNRVLSASELTTEHDALKTKYGIS